MGVNNNNKYETLARIVHTRGAVLEKRPAQLQYVKTGVRNDITYISAMFGSTGGGPGGGAGMTFWPRMGRWRL